MRRVPDVMAWLRAGIPLTLLIDLLDERGPNSAALLAEPSAPADDAYPVEPARVAAEAYRQLATGPHAGASRRV